MSMANPVSLWAFLAGVTVERGEPRGHPAFQTCAQGAIPVTQPADTAKQLRLLMRGGASGRSPTSPTLAPASGAPDLYLSRLIGAASPWEPRSHLADPSERKTRLFLVQGGGRRGSAWAGVLSCGRRWAFCLQSQVLPGAAVHHVPAEAAVTAADLAQPGMRVGTDGN